MARLTGDAGTSFIILDGVQLYDEAEIDRICARHDIGDPDRKMALWRLLEERGRALIDQRRLQTRRTQTARLRQDLQMGLRLTGQLASLVPDGEQLRTDTPSMTLSRRHLAALREAERQLSGGPEIHTRVRLEEVAPALACLHKVFEAALEACGEREDEHGPEETWRAALTAFFTRNLSRPWSRQGDNAGERFLADCRATLERVEDEGDASAQERVLPVRLAARSGP